MNYLLSFGKSLTQTEMQQEILRIREFKLTNCLKISHKENPMTFQNTVMELQKYIEENKLIPIIILYTFTIQEGKTQDELDNFHADAYILISPNIL